MKTLAALLLSITTLLSLPARGESLPEITRYQVLLHTVETSPSPRSLMPLFEAGRELQSAVMAIDDSELAWLERLSDEQAEALQAELRGIRLHRGLDVHAEIDGASFLAMARRHGTPEDVTFFERYQQSFNEQALPVYLRFTDRAAPCVRYDDPALLEQYDSWHSFRREHPSAYPAFVQLWLADIEDVFAQGTCTCTATQEPVETALANFIERFPDAPVRNDAAARLQQLREAPYIKPVWCR